MKAHSFFSRFIRNNKQRQQISVAIFPESLTLAFQADELWVIDTIEATNSAQRVTAIEELLKRNHLVDCQTKIVLGHGLYQSLLIEKPEIPQEEWATALPFLIKDLVNESPMEMVADGFIAPLKERLQVFAASRTVLEPLIKAIRQAGSDVSTISTEEVQWGAFTSGSMSQLILHRRQDAGLHLTAFKRQVMCFQRQLRGVTFPLMGDDASATQVQLQLDGLALELQRSLDFLSAQLRDMPIAQLLISCDGEDDLRLAQELSERLSVKVVAVAPSAVALDSNASRIAWSGFSELPEAVIDLYSEGLKPKTQLLTLPNVAASWVIGAMLIGALAGWHQWQNYVVSQKLAAEQNRLAVKQSEITGLKQRLAEHIPSPLKVELAGNLEQHIAAQQATLKAIEGHDDSLRVGFAGMLRELSDAANGDISLNHIFATGHALDLAGIARSPESVPSWIQAFQSHEHLMDRRFQVMKLGRQEENENVVTFQLQATRSNVSVGASNE
ncbi:MSHA biogenesis protein MshI [Photobacterium jeanii]|uniref:MSHA biogenesis protein MshI n=1 Tax=Photobacterium jeanii TaxID=858640 RepID=A0A178KHB3_9GAMM|nr:PilN domain-containing protein [Photobacterium jeanii]OAN16506.1 MSHA biogenesis protein MshI [Photobacterium jeanii]PST87900.1 MSHA biogenesis protein MshI [Photobacterium jeanii]